MYAAGFIRRYKKFLWNIATTSGLLALGDLSVQILYEKKKPLDQKRLRMIIVRKGNVRMREFQF